ncbi:MAG: peptidoglycan-associated lipoprotein Pal [Methylobacillus sp.]|nr:peptidoglycan-associated lipoprotein Pal [Methylobacillus sp.]
MSKRLLGVITLAVFLAACSSTKVKEEPAASVEDKSVNSQSGGGSSSTTGTAGTGGSTGNPLTDPNSILSKRSIYFDFDKDDVKPEFRPLVEAHAKYLKQNPEAKIMIQGNTDDRGSREYNLALGQRRAVSVKNAMNVYGASDNQIETVSYGKEKPRCTEATETCWAQNRRADILYSGE